MSGAGGTRDTRQNLHWRCSTPLELLHRFCVRRPHARYRSCRGRDWAFAQHSCAPAPGCWTGSWAYATFLRITPSRLQTWQAEVRQFPRAPSKISRRSRRQSPPSSQQPQSHRTTVGTPPDPNVLGSLNVWTRSKSSVLRTVRAWQRYRDSRHASCQHVTVNSLLICSK